MSNDLHPIGIGIVGTNESVTYVRERLSTQSKFALKATQVITSPAQCGDEGSHLSQNFIQLSTYLLSEDTQVIYLAGTPNELLIRETVKAKKHLIVDAPVNLSAQSLREISEQAVANRIVAVVNQPRNWTAEFASLLMAIRSRKFGSLLRLRISIHELTIPGTELPNGTLRDIGSHYLDQVLFMVDGPVNPRYLAKFHDGDPSFDNGFLAVLESSEGTSITIEVQTRSLLSIRTGWIVEGTTGAYRAGRIYTKCDDGEIVDDTLKVDSNSSDLFWDQVEKLIRNKTSEESFFTGLAHAADVVQLVENLELMQNRIHIA